MIDPAQFSGLQGLRGDDNGDGWWCLVAKTQRDECSFSPALQLPVRRSFQTAQPAIFYCMSTQNSQTKSQTLTPQKQSR